MYYVTRYAPYLTLILDLDEISNPQNGFPQNTRDAADSFTATVCRFPFLMNVVILEKVASVMKAVSQNLQVKSSVLLVCVS